MSKITCRFLLVGLCSLIQVTSVYAFNPDRDPSLVGCWKLDETSGSIAFDSSGNGNDGTVSGNPNWVPGKLDGAMDFDGNTYINCGNSPVLNFQDAITASTWVNIRSISAAWMAAVAKGENAWRISVNNLSPTFHFGITYWTNANYSTNGTIQVGYNEWHHVTGTFDGTDIKLYVDGVLDATTTGAAPMGTSTTNLLIGENPEATGRYWDGLIDDVRIYRKALLPEDIAVIMAGVWDPVAENPSPADEQTDVPRDAVLAWKPGPYAATHDVYFGTVLEDVNNASRTAPAGLLVSQGQDANSYDPPGRLDFGTTYYWRIDEVNDAPDNAIFKGAVWSFTAEPLSYPVAGVIATASGSSQATTGPEKTVDGSGLNDNDEHSTATEDGWVSAKGDPQWIQYELPYACKLDKMLVWNSNQMLEYMFGFGVKDVTIEWSLDGAAWTTLGTFEFAQAPGSPDYTADTTVDFGGTVAKFVKLTINSNWGGIFQQYGLSEVRFYSIPVLAREPNPAQGATNVHPQVAIGWRAGREAGSHELYIGPDPNAVADGAVALIPVAQPAYDFAADLGQSYYWKVVEVNQAEDPTSWAGPVWDFSTATYISVDDFESYTNDSPKRVFQTWIDGAGFSPDDFFPNGDTGNGTGSLVGYDPQFGDIMETAYTYAGQQSMPLYYDNSAAPKVSEAVRTLDPARDTTDWTKHDITTLVLWFRGDVNNVGAPVYVKINSTKVLYNNGAAATTMPFWKAFQIDLASVPASDLQNVKTLTIGVGDGSGGGTGTILIDEIRLYATPPQIIVPTDPGTTGLASHFDMEGDRVTDSVSGITGAANNLALTASVTGLNQAIGFNGTNSYVDLGADYWTKVVSKLSSCTFAVWVNYNGAAGAWQRVFDLGCGSNVNVFLTTGAGTIGIARFVVKTNVANSGSTDTGYVETSVSAARALTLGWHHLAGVVDATGGPTGNPVLYIYVDGALAGGPSAGRLPKDMVIQTGTPWQMWLGRSQYAADPYFNGSIDELRVYDRALSVGEIGYLAGDR